MNPGTSNSDKIVCSLSVSVDFCRTRAFMVWQFCNGLGSRRLEDAVVTVRYNYIV